MSQFFASGGQSFGASALASSPSNEYSGLISFGIDWLDVLAVQGTLKSLLQRHSSEASILQCSAFFMVQLSCPYMTTGKIIALTRWIFVGKLMSLLFNMLSICQQTWKAQQWPQDWKRSVFIKSQRRAMRKNVQTTAQLHSSHTLAR